MILFLGGNKYFLVLFLVGSINELLLLLHMITTITPSIDFKSSTYIFIEVLYGIHIHFSQLLGCNLLFKAPMEFSKFGLCQLIICSKIFIIGATKWLLTEMLDPSKWVQISLTMNCAKDLSIDYSPKYGCIIKNMCSFEYHWE